MADEALEPKPEPTCKLLRLDHFLQLKSLAGSGGQAKMMIQNGEVKVNGEIETRRRRKLIANDTVMVEGKCFTLDNSASAG